jgi:hypothetical protein
MYIYIYILGGARVAAESLGCFGCTCHTVVCQRSSYVSFTSVSFDKGVYERRWSGGHGDRKRGEEEGWMRTGKV